MSLTDRLIRRLLPQDGEAHPAELRARLGLLAALVGIIVNLLLAVGKLVTGLLVQSVAIRGDAVNNFSDSISSAIALVSFRMSQKPADRRHPFGHARVEYFASTIVAVLILLIAAVQFRDSVARIRAPGVIPLSPVVFVVLTASILLKVGLYFFYRSLARRIDSQLLMATAVDSLSDVLATAAVLAASCLSPALGFDLDGYLGIAVAGFIAWSGIGILRDTADHTLGTAPPPEFVSRIEAYLSRCEIVLGVHDIIVHAYGPGRNFVTADVEVDARSDLLAAHDRLDNLERNAMLDLGINLSIHMDPIVLDDPETSRLYELTKRTVQGLDPRLSIHDFRVVPGPARTNLIFDVGCPDELKKEDCQLHERIIDALREHDPNWNIVVTVDSSFVARPSTRLR
ncbi:MAG: cation diffusion facilitator family transporter [Bacillota bacterium]|nr:cation diffusion facilitator family transporter [Bacillota bacterium]